MWLVRLCVALVALHLAVPASAADKRCPVTPLHDFIRRGQDLYLGELHGTVEAPALVRCLVIAAMERKSEPVIVSLEQQTSARNLESDVWRGTDGRGSEAMWSLTQFLLKQERAGRLEFHQQLSVPVVFTTSEEKPVFDAAAYEKNMGAPLRELAARGQLIALSGNLHSRKERMPQLAYDPAGMYAGPDVLHVDLAPAAGGTAWVCLADGCRVHEFPEATWFNSPPATLIDGKKFGHDFVYLMPRLTASPPKMRDPNPQTSGR